MIEILKNIKRNFLSNKKKSNYIAAENLERKVTNLNIKSKEYLEMARKNFEKGKKIL